jgi:hypothetical protein
MNRHANFVIALALATLITLLASVLVLLPECMPGPRQAECVSARQLSALVYAATAVGLIALSIVFHRRQSRIGSVLAILALMIVPLVAAVIVSR